VRRRQASLRAVAVTALEKDAPFDAGSKPPTDAGLRCRPPVAGSRIGYVPTGRSKPNGPPGKRRWRVSWGYFASGFGIEVSRQVEKRQGYCYEHLFSHHWNAMKGYHALMRLAHLLNALALATKQVARWAYRRFCVLCAKVAPTAGCTARGCNNCGHLPRSCVLSNRCRSLLS
jgi:hypothetical protein